MTREWMPVERLGPTSGLFSQVGDPRRGVLVKDGAPGEPTAEQALREAMNALALLVHGHEWPGTKGLHRSACLAVLRRALAAQEPNQ